MFSLLKDSETDGSSDFTYKVATSTFSFQESIRAGCGCACPEEISNLNPSVQWSF
jgi:hypothetical protein